MLRGNPGGLEPEGSSLVQLRMLWLFTATVASACSCASVTVPTVPSCAEDARVFSATVTERDLPHGLFTAVDPVEVTLRVDTVYKGAVREQLVSATGWGNGDCGMPLHPGTRVVVCDDGGVDSAALLHFCFQPALENSADQLEAELLLQGVGEPHPPEAGKATLPWMQSQRRGLLLGLLPILGAAAGIAAGALRRRWRSDEPPRRLRWGRVLIAAAVAGGLLRGLGVVAELYAGVQVAAMFLPLPMLALAVVGPAFIGALAGRWPGLVHGRVAGFGLAVSAGGVVLGVAQVPRVLPVDRPGAVECSIERARQALRTGTEPGRACTWWGLAELEETRTGKLTPGGCYRFLDGDRQVWQVCPDERARVVSEPGWSVW